MNGATGWRNRIVLLAAVLGIAATARLGVWQLDRAAQKETAQALLASRAALPVLSAPGLAHDPTAAAGQHHQRVRLHGCWRPEHTVFLENRQMNGRTGFHVVTPLQLSGGRCGLATVPGPRRLGTGGPSPEPGAPGGGANAVLVQRGWAPRNMLDRTLLPAVPSSAAEVEIEGRIAPPPARLYEFADAATGPIRQNLDLRQFAVETGLALRPLSVLQTDSAATVGDGLLRQWPRPAADVDKHYGYAFQWFALAALMAGLYVWFQLVRPRLRHRTQAES